MTQTRLVKAYILNLHLTHSNPYLVNLPLKQQFHLVTKQRTNIFEICDSHNFKLVSSHI